jgi:hypothetical protein
MDSPLLGGDLVTTTAVNPRPLAGGAPNSDLWGQQLRVGQSPGAESNTVYRRLNYPIFDTVQRLNEHRRRR